VPSVYVEGVDRAAKASMSEKVVRQSNINSADLRREDDGSGFL